jgi:hypothetical protein
MLNKISVGFPIIVSKFEKHNVVKEQLLKFIDEQEICDVQNSVDRISRTDWYLQDRTPRKYFTFLENALTEHMRIVYNELNYPEFQYENYWFQQYYKSDTHVWHRHQKTFWSNVYYVELPIGTPPTVIMDPLDKNNIIVPDVSEGYILTFPSILLHCSPINTVDERKTVIAFNVN